MNKRTRRIRTLLLLGAAATIALVCLGAQAADLLHRADLSTVNMRFSVRGQTRVPDLAIVSIEDRTITGQGRTWPMNRKRHAKVVEALAKAGAKVIAYDVQFTEPSGDTDEDVRADNALIEAVRAAAPKMVMATTEVEKGGRTSVFGGGEGLRYSRATPANSNYAPDDDGRIRRMAFKIDDLKTFPITAAEKMVGHPIKSPAGVGALAWIDYPGPPGTIPYISFDDVDKGRLDPADVRGKLVVVGASAPILQDRHSTSTSGSALMPGPEIQAAAAATAMQNFPLRSGP